MKKYFSGPHFEDAWLCDFVLFLVKWCTRWQLVNIIKLKCYFLSKLWSKTLRRWCVWKEIIGSFDFCTLRTFTSTSRVSTKLLAFFGSAHFKFLFLSHIFATFWEGGYSTAYKKQGKKLFFPQNVQFLSFKMPCYSMHYDHKSWRYLRLK